MVFKGIPSPLDAAHQGEFFLEPVLIAFSADSCFGRCYTGRLKAGEVSVAKRQEKQRAICPFVALGGLLGVVISLADNPMSLAPLMGGAQATRWFLAATITASVLGCFVLAVCSRKQFKGALPVDGGGLVASLGLLIGWAAGVTFLPLAVVAAGGALFGGGLAFSFVRWGGAFGGEREHDALVDVSGACFLAALLKALYLALSAAVAWAAVPVLIAGLILSCFIPAPANFDYPMGTWSDAVQRLRRAGVRNWLPATGLILLAYITASVWGANTVGQSVETVLGVESSWGSTVGFVLGAFLLYVLARKTSRDGLRLLYRLVPVVFVALLLLAWLLASVTGFLGQFAFNIPIGCALAVMGSLLWVRLVVLDDALDARLVFGAIGACYTLFFLVVFLVWPLVGDTLMSLFARLFMVVFLVVVAVVATVGVRSEDVEADSHDFKRLGEERCRVIGEQACLSPRENEILVLLAQGRSAPFIAEELFVSTNTVKTHIRRIYTKMGVHSKEELLDVVHNG